MQPAATMGGAATSRVRPRPNRLDLVLVLVVTALFGGTLVLLTDPSLRFVIVDRSLDVAIGSLAALASFSLTGLALVRYREGHRIAGLFQSGAFLLLGVIYALNVALVLFKVDRDVGLSLLEPGQWPLYVSILAWLAAVALLVTGGVAALQAGRSAVPRVRHVLLVPVVVLLVGMVLLVVRDLLPEVLHSEALERIENDPRVAGQLPGVAVLGFAGYGIGALACFFGAIIYRQTYLRRGLVADAYLAVGLVLAGFGEIHAALYPGIYSGLVTTADGLRLAFFLVLLLGIDAEARNDLRALRRAYAALDRLRQSEAERVTLEERTRLAREIHDGLAQHLWFAKLKHERLASSLPDGLRDLSAEVTQALDSAIVEARQAVVTMRSGPDPDAPLEDMLSRAVDDFASRSGIRVELSADRLPGALPARRHAETLRVVQEALTNVRKHADATVVRVKLTVEGDDLVVTVSDNGRGFNPEAVRGDGLGLQGMEERARLMGGELRVASELSDGTNVSLRLPLYEQGGIA